VDVLDHVREPRLDYREAPLLSGDGQLVASNGSIFAVRRDAYERANGFDERYFLFYEEVDFGLTLRRLGLFHYIASYPVVYHMGGATNSDPVNVDAAAQLVRSRKLFTDKWGATVAAIRTEFGPAPATKTWNSQLAFLRD
jgi:GT2 family glycosyltransferase